MTIDVVPNDLRRAAHEMESAATQVSHADPSSRTAEIAQGLPGGAAAEQAPELVEKLEKRFKYWNRDAMKLHEGYLDAAYQYETTDGRISAQAAKNQRELDQIHGG